jgi:protein involved in polysaccharide export with SLBB domain
MPLLSTVLRAARVVVLGLALAVPVAAQQGELPQLPPGMTPEQAREILRQRPDLAARVRQWIEQSGLAPNEIRQRLRERGYPADLLDTYLAADTLRMDSLPRDDARPSDAQVGALDAIGVAQITRQDSLLFQDDSVGLRLYRDSLRVALVALDSARIQPRGLPLFGFETLRQPTTQFQPVVAGPVDDTYVLGPGDELVLILTGAVELVRTFEVTRDGLVVLPEVGRLSANSLSLGQFRRVIGERLARVYSGASDQPGARTRFEVTVSRVRVQQIRVVGEVMKPGTYSIAATGGVLTALYDAGGPTQRANFRQIEVRRGERMLGTVDLYDYLARGVVSSSIALGPGDVIHVPLSGTRVAVAGEVRRPARYDVRPGEGLREVLQLAGGLTALGAAERATISRVVPPEQRTTPGLHRTVVTVDLTTALGVTAPPLALYDGDSITVFRVTGGRRQAVAVAGSVWQPGVYEVAEGMRLWDALQAAGGTRPETYRGRVQVIRTLPDSSRRMFAVALGPDGGPPAENPPLMERDSIIVYARTDLRTARWVYVSGAVQRPDSFPFAEAMTARDGILMAGGITDDASLLEAEINRVRLSDVADSVATVLTVPLDSSYVFDATAYVARPVGAGGPDVVLHPWDQVVVRRLPGVERPRRVTITGAVASPGTYTLLTRTERLGSLVTRAGGLLPDAHPNGIVFFRHLADGSVRRVPAALDDVLRNAGHRENHQLADRDSIDIPLYSATVRVEGAVNAPSVVAWRSGAGIRYYVDAAGGFAQDAMKGDAFAMQANGHVRKGGRPGPGSTVVVPAKDLELERPSAVPAIFAAIATVIGSLTTIVVVLVR